MSLNIHQKINHKAEYQKTAEWLGIPLAVVSVINSDALDAMIADAADAHSCTANAEDGYCTVCGKDVRKPEDMFGPCELGTCTCCR